MTIEEAEEIYMASVVGKFTGTRGELAQALLMLEQIPGAETGELADRASEAIRAEQG